MLVSLDGSLQPVGFRGSQGHQADRRSLLELQLHADNQDLNRFNRLKGFIMNPESMNSPAAPYPLNQLPYSNFPQVAGRQPDLLPHMLPGSSSTCTHRNTLSRADFR